MSRFVYTKEMIAFIRAEYTKAGVAEVTAAFNAKFGADKTEVQIKSTIKNHRIKCGRTTGQINKGVFKLLTPEQVDWVKTNFTLLPIAELTAEFNKVFSADLAMSQLRAFVKNHGIKSGRTGQFAKGQTSWNQGKKGWDAGGRSAETRFKKGHSGNEMKPVGATRICSKDGYVMVKVAMPNKWRLKHVVEWEMHNGKVPAGHRLWFKDNDRTNWAIDNLMLISRAQGAVINKMGFGTVLNEFKPAAVTLADIAMSRRKLTQQAA